MALKAQRNPLKAQDKFDEAIKAYDKAIEINPQFAEAWNNKGVALKARHHDEDAIKAYDEAIKLNPKFAMAWNNKGIVLHDIGKDNEYRSAYIKAMSRLLMGQSKLMMRLSGSIHNRLTHGATKAMFLLIMASTMRL